MTAERVTAETTDDMVLGGRLLLRQPRRGHRVGHDAILLAAAVAARAGQSAVDLGAGVGAAGLALAARVPGLIVTLVEIDPELAVLAEGNIARNNLADRARAVALDAAASPGAFEAAGLPAGSADHVLMNPPFNDPARQNVSPDARRRAAHVAGPDLLADWLRAAFRLLRPAGVVTLIWRADDLPRIVETMRGSFGDLTILPVHPTGKEPAIRLLIRATKGSRAPLLLLPGLILNGKDGRPTADAEAVLRNAAALPLAEL